MDNKRRKRKHFSLKIRILRIIYAQEYRTFRVNVCKELYEWNVVRVWRSVFFFFVFSSFLYRIMWVHSESHRFVFEHTFLENLLLTKDPHRAHISLHCYINVWGPKSKTISISAVCVSADERCNRNLYYRTIK